MSGQKYIVALFADGVSYCFLAGFANFCFVLAEAGQNFAIAQLNIAAMGLDIGLAFLSDVVDRYRQLLEQSSCLVKGILALT